MSKLGDGSYCGVPNCPCGGVKSIENMTREEWHADIARREAKQREGHLKRWMEDATQEGQGHDHEEPRGNYMADGPQFDCSLCGDAQAWEELAALESAAREALEQLDYFERHNHGGNLLTEVIKRLRSALKAL